jgi:hypothetical protein
MPKVFCRRCNNPNVVKITDVLIPVESNNLRTNPLHCEIKATLYQCEDCDAVFCVRE